jgi:hypothetical protein
MRRDLRTILTVVALGASGLLATACGAETGDVVGASPQTSSPSASTGSATATEPGGRMTEGISQPVVLVRTGGIGGLKDRLELRPDGTYTVVRKGSAPVTRQMSEGQLAAIVNALQQADLSAASNQSATSAQSDQFTYMLKAQGTTLTTTETTAPQSVRPLLDELNTLFSAPAATR